MKAIILSNLPPELAEAVRKEAERKRISVNKAVISLLERKAEEHKKSPVRSGSMTTLTRSQGPGQEKKLLNSTWPWQLKGL